MNHLLNKVWTSKWLTELKVEKKGIINENGVWCALNNLLDVNPQGKATVTYKMWKNHLERKPENCITVRYALGIAQLFSFILFHRLTMGFPLPSV